MNAMYPQVIFPAFRMQSNMMMYTLGTNFWLGKRNKLESVRLPGTWLRLATTPVSPACTQKRIQVIKKSQRIKAMEEKRLKAIQQREVKRRMGTMKYYAMPWERAKYMAALEGGKVRSSLW